MSTSRRTASTLDSRCVPLWAHEYRAYRIVQAALQIATAVRTSSQLLRVGSLCGRGEICAVVERTPAVMLVEFAP